METMRFTKLGLWIPLLLVAAAEAQSLEGCLSKCGDVEIPYPFGIGVQSRTGRNCFLQESFELTCNSSTSTLLYGDHPVSNISVQGGHLDISMSVSKVCYNQPGVALPNPHSLVNNPSFAVSSTQNKFISVGCDTLGIVLFQNNRNSYGGCVTLCDAPPQQDLNDKTCSGTGCCQVDIPVGMRNISFVASSVYNHTNVSDFNNCSYSFVAKKNWFNFSVDYLRDFPFDMVPLVLNWSVSDHTCHADSTRSDNACTANTDCADSNDGFGYNCKCKPGFDGNPYHPDGCHDVDECQELANYNCVSKENCRNTIGSFECFWDPVSLTCPPLIIPPHPNLGRPNLDPTPEQNFGSHRILFRRWIQIWTAEIGL